MILLQKWEFQKLELKDAYLIKPFYADDNRGGFIKDYSKEVFEQNGINYDLKEVFYTISHRGVIRAIHFQNMCTTLLSEQPHQKLPCRKGRFALPSFLQCLRSS